MRGVCLVASSKKFSMFFFFVLAISILFSSIFAAAPNYPNNSQDCKKFCQQQYLSLIVSGTYALDIDYLCSFATGACEFSLIPPSSNSKNIQKQNQSIPVLISNSGTLSSQSKNQTSPSTMPNQSSTPPNQSSTQPNQSSIQSNSSINQNSIVKPFVSFPSNVFEEKCQYNKTTIT